MTKTTSAIREEYERMKRVLEGAKRDQKQSPRHDHKKFSAFCEVTEEYLADLARGILESETSRTAN